MSELICNTALQQGPGQVHQSGIDLQPDSGPCSDLQVLISIQSMIFVSDPYYNEPGYETMRNTQAGRDATKAYDEQQQLNTMLYAISPALKAPCPAFADAIRYALRLQVACQTKQVMYGKKRACMVPYAMQKGHQWATAAGEDALCHLAGGISGPPAQPLQVSSGEHILLRIA